MSPVRVTVNRAPVLTLWGAVVAERLGHDRDTALTLGKAVAGLNAQSKGQRLGIFTAKEKPEGKAHGDAAKPAAKRASSAPLLGREVPVAKEKGDLRATIKGEPIDPASVTRYLEKAFGDDLADVRAAFVTLAKSRSKDDLAREGFHLYERFRPSIPAGQKGWGAKGILDLAIVRALAKRGE